jgi:hypothetical protein
VDLSASGITGNASGVKLLGGNLNRGDLSYNVYTP